MPLLKVSALIVLFACHLWTAGPVYAQLPGEVIVESSKRSIAPVPGDESFDVTRHTVPLRDIRGGGPPRDGIPALVDPSFVSADNARRLHPPDQVLGVSLGGRAKAYPVRILNWHELVNDYLESRPILVSW